MENKFLRLYRYASKYYIQHLLLQGNNYTSCQILAKFHGLPTYNFCAAGLKYRSQVTGDRSQGTGYRSQVTGYRSKKIIFEGAQNDKQNLSVTVSFYPCLLAVSFYSGLLAVSFHFGLLAVSF